MPEMFTQAFAFGLGLFSALAAIAAAIFIIGFGCLWLAGLIGGIFYQRSVRKLKAEQAEKARREHNAWEAKHGKPAESPIRVGAHRG